MKENSTLLAISLIPIFFLFLGIEYWISKRRKIPFGSFENSISNIVTGLAERTFNLFLYAFFIRSFFYVYDHFRLFTIESNWVVWILILPVTDFVWYWYHRLGHEVNIMWAAHVVHHQSEDFNFTVAARITALQAIIRNLFYCLLPLIGFHPTLVSITLVIHGAYSFFTHTRIIKNLGILEYILITPSHHRVHHASNELYLNKNYGDLFVFWDKLFGTFQKEENNVKTVYGLTEPIESFSFLWQHFHFYFELFYHFKRAKGLKNKIIVLFGKPELLPHNTRKLLEIKLFRHRKKHTGSKQLKRYLTFQIVASCFLLVWLIYQINRPLNLYQFTLASILLLTFVNCGALLEQKRWIIWVEYVRAFFILLLLGHSFLTITISLTLYTVLIIILNNYKIQLKYWRWMFK